MTALHEPATGPLTELELLERQLEAINRFTQAQRAAHKASAEAAASRELRMDAARRLAVIRRQHDALIARSHQQLIEAGERPLTVDATRRAVLAHRNEWFRDRVASALVEYGVTVVARAENGADAIGIAIAEQPDVVLVEDGLEMMPADAVIRELRQWSPASLIAAQVPYSDRMAPLVEAGAAWVFVRQVPPVDVASGIWELLSATPNRP